MRERNDKTRKKMRTYMVSLVCSVTKKSLLSFLIGEQPPIKKKWRKTIFVEAYDKEHAKKQAMKSIQRRAIMEGFILYGMPVIEGILKL